jgi:hypothetical protein
MVTHDPRKVVETLRNHLASHDTPLCFLFGAGTSSSIRIKSDQGNGKVPLIPAIGLLTERCKVSVQSLGKGFVVAWNTIESECKELGYEPNIENILSRIRVKIEALGANDTSLGLSKKELAKFEVTICEEIIKQTTPEEGKIPEYPPHYFFARWIKQITRKRPVEIFTTNYDYLIERSLERARIPVFDGFVGCHEPFFSSECVENENLLPSIDWVRLWKIHGSVNWCEVTYKTEKRIIRTRNRQDQYHMILPSNRKYDESRKQPYQSLIDRLGKVLSHNGAILVTCGFSFGDQHINEIIFNVLDANPLSHVIALMYESINENDQIVKAALRPNFMVIARNGGVCQGRWGEWKLCEPIDTRTYNFMDVLFDSDAVLEKEEQSLTGEMRIGDFNRFCKALAEMGGEPYSLLPSDDEVLSSNSMVQSKNLAHMENKKVS